MLVLKNNEIAQRHMALNMHRFSIRLNRHARFGIRRINNCHFYGLRCRPSFDDHKSGQVRIFQKRRGLATWRVRIARVSVVRVRVVIILPTSSQGERQTLELPRLGQKARTPSPRNWQQGRPTGSRSRSRSSSAHIRHARRSPSSIREGASTVSAGRQSRAGRYWRLHALRLVPNSVSDLLILVLFRRQELRLGTVRYALRGGSRGVVVRSSVHSHRCF
jgi:hypothetical protein